MSYKSEWIATLAKFKTKIKSFIDNPNDITLKDLEEAKDNFRIFVNGHSIILKDNIQDRNVIEMFNKVFSNNVNATLSVSKMRSGLEILIESIDNAIIYNKDEDKMTTNYNINGSAQFGDNNSQINNQNTTNIDIKLQTLISEIERSDDKEAKSKLKDLLNNGTVASIIGATTPEILKAFGII